MKCFFAVPALALAGCLMPHASEDALPSLVSAPPLPSGVEILELTGETEGEAVFVVLIDEEGRVVDWLAVGASHPALENLAAERLPLLRFESARQRRSVVQVGLVFWFGPEGGAILPLNVEQLHAGSSVFRAGIALRLFQIDQLDFSPRLLKDVRPDAVGSGVVKVQFVISPEGAVHMPVVIEGTDRAIEAAVVNAVGQWRFTPPTRRGEPVAVLTRQVFRFSP